MRNIGIRCRVPRQGATSVVPNAVRFLLKGRGFSRAVEPRVEAPGFSPANHGQHEFGFSRGDSAALYQGAILVAPISRL